jgi:hypothetical protein
MLDKSTYSLKIDSSLGIYASTCLYLLLKVALPIPIIPYYAYSTDIKLSELRKKLVSGISIIYNHGEFVRIVRKGVSNN